MLNVLRVTASAILFTAMLASQAVAALEAVSGSQVENELTAVSAGTGDESEVAVSLANGFPLWYQDHLGVKLAQCLDTTAEIGGLGKVDPCQVGRTFEQFPPSLINLDEVLYWQAEAAFNYVSSQGEGFALLTLALEGGGANENPVVDGNQAVFSRIRLRIDVPVTGTYRVTHPFGTFDYEITDAGSRSIDQTQDVGVEQAQNFLAAMRDRGAAFEIPTSFTPAEDDSGAVVNGNGATIGPFLVPTLSFSAGDSVGGPVAASNGSRYIGLPATADLAAIAQPVAGSAVNFFRIELLSPPDGFELNPGGDNPQVVQVNDFQVVGKIFADGLNRSPAAPQVRIGVLKGRTFIDIDVFAGQDFNELDPVGPENVQGIDPQAIALADPVTGVLRAQGTGLPLLTEERATAAGGTVRRISNLASGQSLFRYNLPTATSEAFADTFHYVTQDRGGLISAPSQVAVMVEDLQIAHAYFRAKTGKWHIGGSTDHTLNNTVTLFAGPRAHLSGTELVPDTTMAGDLSLSVGEERIEYHLRIDGVTSQTVAAVNLHLAGSDQPAIFRLCGNPFIFPFPPSCAIVNGALDVRSSITNFDLVLGSAAAGITSFVLAAEAILSGKTYVNVATAAHAAGEIRGPVLSPPIAVVPVNAEGEWVFRGNPRVWFGRLPSVTARSAVGAQTFTTPLSLR